MKTIVVTRRGNKWHVCLEGEAGIWSRGKTAAEAIGELLLTHAKKFDIKIEENEVYPGLFS